MNEGQGPGGHQEPAYAKINLALHVRRRLPSGYHEIETIFAFLKSGDVISVDEGKGLELSLVGPFAGQLDVSTNLVWDAAHMLAKTAGVSANAYIKLDKRLPLASGIGGGSADAAATLRLLNRFWNINLSPDELATIALPLGADVPACVKSQTARGHGVGQDLTPFEDRSLTGHCALLVNPLIPISTAEVFGNWDGEDRGPLPEGTLLEIAQAGRNDLQSMTEKLVPEIGRIIDVLNNTAAVIARMSGSGATCFGLYSSKEAAEEAEESIKTTFPNAWTMVDELR